MEIILNRKKGNSLIEKLERKVEQKIKQRGAFRKTVVLKWVMLLTGMVLFFTLGYFLRWLDPLSAILDGGVIMLLLLGAIAVMMAHIWAIWAVETILVELLSVCRNLFNEPIKLFTSWQIILTYGATYFLLFWSFLWCFSKWL